MVIAHLLLVLEVRGLIPTHDKQKFWCLNMLHFVSFAGMTLDKCAILWTGTLSGGPMCRLKNHTVFWIWLLVCLHPATLSV